MNEISKICFTVLFSFIILYVLEIIQRVPKEYEENLSEAIEKGDLNKIKSK